MNFEEKILLQIKNNKLENLDYDFLIAQLCVLNNKTYEDIRVVVNRLVQKGEVKISGYSASNNAPSEPKKQVSKKPYFKQGKKRKDYHKNYIPTSNNAQSDLENNIDLAYKMLNQKDSKKKTYKIQGKIQSTSKGYAFLIPTDPNYSDVFIAERDLKGALNNDMVVIEVTYNGNRKPEGKVIQVLERGNDSIIGKITISKKGAFVAPDDVKFGKDIYVPLDKTMGASNGYKVVAKIDKYYGGNKNPEGSVIEVLGEPNSIETEVLAVIRSYKLYETFPKRVTELAEAVPTEIDKSKYKNRLDLTKEICFTIDGEDSRDLDDAISLTQNEKGNYVLGVHIADVGEYVPRDSIIDKEAYKRGTSVYFPNLVLPMLPRQLSNGICSLNERVDRLALSVFIEYDNNFRKLNSEIKETIINSKKRFTYTEVFAIFNGDKEVMEKNKAFVPMLLKMNELAKAIMKERKKQGYIEFDIPEVKVSLDLLGDVLKVEPRDNNDSHKLIEAFMVAANEVVAEKFCRNKTPFVYRVHETPDPEKMAKFNTFIQELGITSKLTVENVKPLELQHLLADIKDNDYNYVVNRICLRSMRKAKYMPECLGHFGLAIKYYCHFTSPIRRYPDLTIHRIIKDSLRGIPVNTAALKDFVEASSIQSSDREVNAEKVERDIDDLYRAMYMRNHLGEEFDGMVSGITAFGVFVELDNTVEGLLRLEDLPADRYEFLEDKFLLKGGSHSYTIGQKLRVKAIGANILTREIDFMLV